MKKETLIAASDAAKIDSKKVFRFAVLIIIAINLLIGVVLNPIETYLASKNALFTETVFYLIKFLSMVAFFVSLGTAFFIAMFKKEFSKGLCLIGIAAIASFLSIMVAAIIQSLDVADGSFLAKMASAALSGLVNAGVSFLILLTGYVLPYKTFLKKVDPSDKKLALAKLRGAAIFAASISAIYNASVLTVQTVDFVLKRAPLYTNEILYIIYEYLFIAVTSAIGVMIILLAKKLYFSARFRH